MRSSGSTLRLPALPMRAAINQYVAMVFEAWDGRLVMGRPRRLRTQTISRRRRLRPSLSIRMPKPAPTGRRTMFELYRDVVGVEQVQSRRPKCWRRYRTHVAVATDFHAGICRPRRSGSGPAPCRSDGCRCRARSPRHCYCRARRPVPLAQVVSSIDLHAHLRILGQTWGPDGLKVNSASQIGSPGFGRESTRADPEGAVVVHTAMMPT